MRRIKILLVVPLFLIGAQAGLQGWAHGTTTAQRPWSAPATCGAGQVGTPPNNCHEDSLDLAGDVSVSYVEWSDAAQSYQTPPFLASPLKVLSRDIYKSLNDAWKAAAVDHSGDNPPTNPFCKLFDSYVHLSDTHPVYHGFKSCTPQPIQSPGAPQQLAQPQLVLVRGISLFGNAFHLVFKIPCANPDVTLNNDFFDKMGYTHCKKSTDANHPEQSAGYPLYSFNVSNFCTPFNCANYVDIYADILIDVTLDVDRSFDVADQSANATGPFHITSASIAFANAFFNPDDLSSNCHDSALLSSRDCLDAEAKINSIGPIDIASFVSAEGINAALRDRSASPNLYDLGTYLTGSGETPLFGTIFNLDVNPAFGDPNGTVNFRLSRDVFPKLDRRRAPSAAAGLGSRASSGTINVFATDLDGAVWSGFNPSGHWAKLGPPSSGVKASAPSAVSAADQGRAESIFPVVVGSDGIVYQANLDAECRCWLWQSLPPLPGAVGASAHPSAVRDAAGHEHVFVTNQHGELVEGHFGLKTSTWKWRACGAPPLAPAVGEPSGIAANGYLGAFVVDASGGLDEAVLGANACRWIDHGRSVGDVAAPGPSAVMGPGGGLKAFVTTARGTLSEFSSTTGWTSLGRSPNGRIVGSPSAAIRPTGGTDVFVIDQLGMADDCHLTSGSCSSFTSQGPPMDIDGTPGTTLLAPIPTPSQAFSHPSLVVAPNGFEEAFVVTSEQHLGEKQLDHPWSDHTPLVEQAPL